MGPAVLFDKSFLQALSVDESVWFDNFFMPVVCPYFFVETLADLEKSPRAGHSSEQEVERIAAKFPDMSGHVCAHHAAIATSELLGAPVPMTGQIPLAGASRSVRAKARHGLVFERSDEEEAFHRWQRGKFADIERRFAKTWRQSLALRDTSRFVEVMRRLGVRRQSCKSLHDALVIARQVADAQPSSDRVTAIATLLGGPEALTTWALSRLRESGDPPIASFAPYSAHVLTVELFYHLALAADRISADRPSNRVDIAYLYYLPFCHLFVSSDRLHERCAPLFLRDNQQFLWGFDLKADLARLNEHYRSLPMNEREKGVMSFASSPPRDGEFLVSRIWDGHWQGWRDRADGGAPMDEVKQKELVEDLNEFMAAPGLDSTELGADHRDPRAMGVSRLVRKRKGSWFQVPKHLDPGKSR